MPLRSNNDFCIEIDFERQSRNPARIFDALSDLIAAIEVLDQELASTIDPNIRTELVLEEIEPGSIRAWFVSILKSIDDNDLEELEWKRIIGKFLVKAKYLLIKALEGKEKVRDISEIEALRRQVEDLQKLMYEMAQERGIVKMPITTPIEASAILYTYEKFTASLAQLTPEDTVKFIAFEESVEFNKSFEISKDEIQDLLTKQTKIQDAELVLKVKKPDYLGHSQWEFQVDRHAILAKIEDHKWLEDFQKRKIDLRPGDSLKAMTHIEARFDAEGNELDAKVKILQVEEVIPASDKNGMTAHLFNQ